MTDEPIRAPCPFCYRRGGAIIVDFDGVDSGGVPCLIHSLPPCETYLRLNADEFIAAIIERKHLS